MLIAKQELYLNDKWITDMVQEKRGWCENCKLKIVLK